MNIAENSLKVLQTNLCVFVKNETIFIRLFC